VTRRRGDPVFSGFMFFHRVAASLHRTMARKRIIKSDGATTPAPGNYRELLNEEQLP
jgi:hypothetical protein